MLHSFYGCPIGNLSEEIITDAQKNINKLPKSDHIKEKNWKNLLTMPGKSARI
jgi:hypothetical protein